MEGIGVNATDLIGEIPELLYIVPSLIFGYLFYLTSELVFLSIAAIWAVVVSVVMGVKGTAVESEDEEMAESLLRSLYVIHFLMALVARQGRDQSPQIDPEQ